MNMRFIFWALLLSLLLLMNACSLTPHVEVDNAVLKRWQVHQQKLSQLKNWELRASMAANSEDDGWNARIHWQQRDEVYQLRLHGPMGQGAIRLQGDAQGVTLYTHQKTYHAATPEALLNQETDINLRLRHLLFWVRGLPVPELEIQAQNFTPKGQLTQLQQDGWEIEFGYYSPASDWLLPKRIRLENHAYIAKIAISQWSVNGEKVIKKQ